MTISSLLVALIRIMCTALPNSNEKTVLDGKTNLLYLGEFFFLNELLFYVSTLDFALL